MAKELNCVQCKKYMGTIKDGTISKGLKPVCTKCFNFMTQAAGNWAQHQYKKGKEKTEYKQFSDLFGSLDDADDAFGDKFTNLFGKK